MGFDKDHVKGRGTALRMSGRFEARTYEAVHPEGLDEVEPASNQTRTIEVHPKRLINRVEQPDIPFSWSINPYQGCEHGCSYCYARPTHEYWGYSAGLDFERVVMVKRNAVRLLEQELGHPRWKGEPITLSGVTDPYQPIERGERITRGLLEVMHACCQPVSIITKNALILRDLDLLAPMAALGLASVAISLTTLDEDLRRALEPRTSTGRQRLHAIRTLTDAGIPVLAMVAPIIPSLNEHEVPALLEAAAEAGAVTASYTVLRTNGAVAQVFEERLRSCWPDRADRVLAGLRSLHGGRVSDSRPGVRMKGEGDVAHRIGDLFRVLRDRHFGRKAMPALTSALFTPPARGQLDLFR